MLLAGNSEWAVRMPSALAAVLLVPLAFAVVREVSGERKGTSWPWAATGVTAAALVGTSPFIAFYAQETRMYSIAAALSLATTWAFLKATRTATLRWWCIFSSLLATSLYTQYFSAFIVPAFWLYALCFDRRTLRRTMLSTALAGLSYLPWLRPAYLQIGRLLRTPDYWVTTRVDLGFFVRAMWNTFLPNAPARLGLLLALLSAILLIHFARQRRFQLSERVRRSTLVFLTFLIPLVLTYAVITLAPKFVTRYAIVVAAPLYICAVLALYPLLSHKAVWMRALFSLLVITAVVMSLRSTLAIVEGRENRRDDVRGLAAYLTQHVQANDALLLAENAPYALQYYYHGATPQYGLHVGENFAHTANVLNGMLGTLPRRVWLILWHREFADPTDMLVTELMRVGRKVDVEEQFLGYQLRAFDIQDYTQRIVAYPDPKTVMDTDFVPGLRLLGFDRFSSDDGRLHYVLYWQAQQRLERNYSLTLILQDLDGDEYLRQDQALSTDYFLPPDWPKDTPIRGRVDVTLPADLPAFTYRAYLQVLDPVTRRNVDLVDERGAPLGQTLLLEEFALSKPALGKVAAEIENPLQIDMGNGLELYGFDVVTDGYSPGEALRLTLWWRCLSTPGTDQQAHFRLLDANNVIVWRDEKPVISRYPTTEWQAEEINRAIYRLAMPADLAGGEYDLQAAVQDNWLSLVPLHIVPREHRYDRLPMQQTLDLPFEEGITLLGYDLEAPSVQPGEAITLTLFWQANEKIGASYKVSVQMLSPDQRIIVQDDSIPVHWTYPTTAWLPEEIIADEHVLTITSETQPGSYTLIVVLYDEHNAQRLGVKQAGKIRDYASLTVLRAVP